MKLKTISQVLLAVAASASVASASAATTVVSDSTNVIVSKTTNWSDFLSFQKFNASQGTLTSVTLDLYSEVKGRVDLTNYNDDPMDVPVSLSVSVKLDRPDTSNLLVINAPLFSATPTVDGNGGTSFVENKYLAHGSAVFTNASDLALFSGTGNINTLIAAKGNSFVQGDNIDALFSTKASGYGTVTYTFTAAPVPEPETYGMLLLGLGMMGVIAKRKQARANKA